MRFCQLAFVALVGLLLAGCAALATTRGERHPLLTAGEATSYLYPVRSHQNQAEVFLDLGMLGAISRDLDRDGHCTTDACRANWESALQDIGLAYSRLGLHFLAINYYREAAKNATDKVNAHSNIAVELDSIGHVEAAQKEFDLALENYDGKDSKFEEVLGRFYMLSDHLDRAREHFERCILLGQPEDTVQYCAIGLALTKWSGGTDSMLLPITVAGRWPGPVLSFVRSQSDEKTLADLVSAEPNPDTRREHLSEALYYVGEWHLGQNEKDLAMRYFHAAVRMRVESFWETWAAARRIEQLHGNSDTPTPRAPASHIPIG